MPPSTPEASSTSLPVRSPPITPIIARTMSQVKDMSRVRRPTEGWRWGPLIMRSGSLVRSYCGFIEHSHQSDGTNLHKPFRGWFARRRLSAP